MSFEHVPVLLRECIEGLEINPNGIYIDGTAGGAGHSSEIAKRLKGGRLYSLDQDPDAIAAASAKLVGLSATVVQTNFYNAKTALEGFGINKVDGVLLDLGVSSHQLDEKSRGFSYQGNAPLDMRMSQAGQTAADIVNNASREELAKILREFGEESFAWQIAGKICAHRTHSLYMTTSELVETILCSLPPKERRKAKNPARKTFQALRIAVNGELDALDRGMDELFDMLNTKGRFCIITFHSLEDRLVKQRFRLWSTACTCKPDMPICVCGGKARCKLITKKPIQAEDNEQEENRRARSAKLRIIEKL